MRRPFLENALSAVSDLRDRLAVRMNRHPGADVMVDVFASLGFEYLFANPSSSVGMIHESLLRRRGAGHPEFITCAHEELAAAMADGYYKFSGRPGLVCTHGTVGLQHAAMALYNSYCDQVPVYVVLGNTADAASRRGRVEWVHSAQDPAALVRDFVKWSDHPASLQHFAESAVRAYEIAMTPPRLPVVLVADMMLQLRPGPAMPPVAIPPLRLPVPAGADPSALREAARLLVRARNPLLLTGRAARSAEGLRLMVELAETLQAGVIDEGWRLNFPTRHPLNQLQRRQSAVTAADVILGLEPDDFFGIVHRIGGRSRAIPQSIATPGTKLIRLGIWQLTPKPNYQALQRHLPVDLDIVADAETALPHLIEAVRQEMTADQRRLADTRGSLAAIARRETHARSEEAARKNWDQRPVSTARLSMELWRRIEHEDWSLVSFARRVSNWPLRLWDFTKHHQYIGGPGGDGLGYTAPAAAGAALANRKHGRLSVCIQPDGDLLSSSSILWTLAHHRIPLLMVMHNNRAYYQEQIHLRRMGRRHGAPPPAEIETGTTLGNPNVDFAGLARSLGVDACGPIDDPGELDKAIAGGIAAVKEGRPYLIDVITQPR